VNSLLTKSRGRISADQWRDLEIKLQALSDALPGVAEEFAVVVGELTTLAAQAAVVSTNLEDGIHALQLTPLQPFLEEYAKVVRVTAGEGRKEARLAIFAEGVEIDRTVLMRLRDPLLHLVRNAVVHGIETPERRVSTGKAACGTVRLEGRCEGTRAIVQVIDDGRGIDVERVRQRALQMKLVGAGDRVGDEQILDVLTHPGFSTQEVADGLAGRGIGLDVVATSVRELDGQLQLSTHPGGGTTFTIDVPITASTGAGLVVRVEDYSFGILLGHVERVLRVGPADIHSLEGRDTIGAFGAPVAVVHLGDLVGVERPVQKAPKKPAVVLRHGKQRLVVVVDDIPGDQTFVVRPLCRAFSGAHIFLGAAIQSDGAILPILQIAALFQRATGAAPGRASRGLGVETTRGKDEISILVVDDSITMRTLLRNILHAARYKVAVAHDGQSALSVLEGLPECHLIITDLQMPRMHGADLCRAVRRSARSNIPIIAVTSIGDDTERRRALEAGADAYIVKSDFEQDHFLSLVARFTGARGAAA
jgi:chemotaxis protein histidine kinase CheA/CheY-like chemotaxis protein